MAAITEVFVYKLTGEVDLMVEFQTHFPLWSYFHLFAKEYQYLRIFVNN
jgi:hypothetical protein